MRQTEREQLYPSSLVEFVKKYGAKVTTEEVDAMKAIGRVMRGQERNGDEAFWLKFLRSYREQNPWPPAD